MALLRIPTDTLHLTAFGVTFTNGEADVPDKETGLIGLLVSYLDAKRVDEPATDPKVDPAPAPEPEPSAQAPVDPTPAPDDAKPEKNGKR